MSNSVKKQRSQKSKERSAMPVWNCRSSLRPVYMFMTTQGVAKKTPPRKREQLNILLSYSEQ